MLAVAENFKQGSVAENMKSNENAAQPRVNHDSPSAQEIGAKKAEFGSGKIMATCKSGEQVTPTLCGKR